MKSAIQALAYELPPIRLSSRAIEDQLHSTMERLNMPRKIIEGLTGIRERRLWEPGTLVSDAAARAAQKALDNAGISPRDIGCLISTSVCKDYVEPSVASMVHGALGLPPECLNFDVCNACLGFINGMETVSLMIRSGAIDYGMIINGESSREPIEATIERLKNAETNAEAFRENFATLTLGSGAAAMILCREDLATTGHVINGGVSMAATQHCRLCLGQKDSMVADAPSVMKYGVELAGRTWERAAQGLENWTDETIDAYIPHQVSARNTTVLCRSLGLNQDKMYLNYPLLGNIGPAAIPITLAMAEEVGRVKTGDHVALLGIGSGLNCSMMSLTW
ncbi:3-Oxoacyl-(acyl carrier protein) synthase III [Desulfatibacillum aliphaticivorans]|uniref:3-Oxoacyl-(Acyl carrier protein) synthase III n=1 Tax=Desulfatibacillum aliphaticivorans TaxID=218208 RepID=B8FHY4_DESAL|nr:3-oxoacyl-ACP synthase III [Desulfatibacillum aliphaticivorans]ACL02551.1 3-Oxoacyl-(acyl carrier protein) synthase III [Desulfatibacillum aliphaticivorans]